MQTTSKQGLSEADVTGLRLLEAVSIDASKKGNLVTDKKLIRDLDEFAAAIRKKRGLATTSPSREKATRWKEDARATMYRSQNRSNIKTDEKKKRRVLGVKMEERYRESKSELWKAGSLESNVEDTRTESVGATMSHKNDTTETTDLNNPRDLYELTLTLCEGLANSDERLKSSIRSKRRQTKLDEWLGVSRGTNYDEASLADITEGRLESRGKDGPEVLNIEEDNKFNQSGVLKPSESQDLDEGEYLLHDGLISQILDMRNLKASNEVQIIDKESELGISEVLNLESRSEVMETRPIVLKEVDIDIEKLAADKDLDFGIPEILNLQTSSEVKETREKGTFDDERSLKEVDIDIDFDLGIPEILNLQASSEVTETEKGTVDNGRSLKETELDIDFDLGISEILNLQTSSEVMETRHIEKREADRDLDLGIPEILNLQARSEVKETTIVEKGTVDNGTSLNEVDIDIAKLETKKELAGMSESLDSKASNEVGTSPKGIVSEEMLKIPVQKLNKLPLRERRNERIKNRRIMVVIQNGRWKIRAGIVGKCPSPPLVVAPALIHQNSEMNSDEEMDAVRSSWEKAFTKMDVDPLDCHALITYKATATTTDRESLVELAFSCFDIAGLYLISDVQACLLSSGKSTGLVIDIGEYQTTIVPVYENLVLQHAVVSMDVGGFDLASYVSSLLLHKNCGLFHQLTPRRQLEAARAIMETYGYVAAGDATSRGSVETRITAPDGSFESILVDAERFQGPEILFSPTIPPISRTNRSLVDAIISSISLCNSALRSSLQSSILVCGGTALLPGLKQRLESALHKEDPTSCFKVQIADLNAAYTGGCLQCDLMPLRQWVTKEEYEEQGPSVVRRKCF